MNSLNLDDTQLFIQVIEHGNFSRAAEYCGIPKSTLSRRIRELENSLGVRLIHRTTCHFTLTELGEKFHDRALRLLQEVEDTKLMLSQQKANISGRLRVFAPIMLNYFFTHEITRFCRDYPQLEFDLRSFESNPNEVAERRFDLLLNPGKLQNSTLIAKPVATFQTGYYASSDYLKYVGEPKSPEQLITHDCIFLSYYPGISPHWHFNDGIEQKRLVLSPKFTVDSPELALHLTQAGLGIAQLPKMLANPLVKQGILSPLLSERYQTATPIYAAYHDRQFQPQKVRLLLSIIEQTMQKTIDILESDTERSGHVQIVNEERSRKHASYM